jgi:hypothetical protein
VPLRETVRVSATTSTGDRLAGALRGDGGWVSITSIAPGGREIVLRLLWPGAVIGDLSALDGTPRSATAVAAGEVEVTVAPGSVLIRALSDAAAARSCCACSPQDCATPTSSGRSSRRWTRPGGLQERQAAETLRLERETARLQSAMGRFRQRVAIAAATRSSAAAVSSETRASAAKGP